MMTRRSMLSRGAAGLAGSLLLPGISRGAATVPGKLGRAKAVIQIWLWGGPSHLDTFDPKPEAGRDYCGSLDTPLATNVDGMRISQYFPQLAKQADNYALIRSMTHGNSSHETASYMIQTGRTPGDGETHPAFGAVITLKKALEAGYTGLIPPYIALTSPLGRFSEAGFLGSRCKPYATGGNPNAPVFAADGIASEGLTRERQLGRRDLLTGLDTFRAGHTNDTLVAKLDTAEHQAYELILGDAGKVFDLTQETDALRDRYGRNTFGQSCLAARRLVEAGVTFVTINNNGWDSHKNNFQTMGRKVPELDAGLATLLDDLRQRGLLDQTIVVCGGEFGRTPKIEWGAPWNGGRNHFGSVFSYLIAGGGFKGGRIVGKSDAKGERVEERPVYPCDLIGSIYRQLGIPTDATLPHPQNRRIMAYPDLVPGKSGGLLDELV